MENDEQDRAFEKVQKNFIDPVAVHFPLRTELGKDAFFADVVRTLEQFSERVLMRAADWFALNWEKTTFPPLGICFKKCREINDIGESSDSKNKYIPTDNRYPEWQERRKHEAWKIIKASGFGKIAAEEGWILALWQFVREKERLPEPHQIANIKATAKKFDGAMATLERDGDPIGLGKLGISMLAVREKMAAIAFGEEGS